MNDAKHALVVTHHECDAPGAIVRALADREIAFRTISTHRGDRVPGSLEGASALVVMGGPLSVNDDRTHLGEERALVRAAMAADVPVIGVCLGSQIVASALGAKVAPLGRKEIGWFEVTLEAGAKDDPLFSHVPRGFTPFHWHSEAFELPKGATPLAHSALTPVQAFRLGRAYAFQFHLEFDAVMIENMADAFPGELVDLAIDRARLDGETRERIAQQERIARAVFGAWADSI